MSVLIIVSYNTESKIDPLEYALYASYPVADSLMLIPSILGVMLFFKGQVKFSLALLSFGMLIFVISDYGFLYFDSIGAYYVGHLVDIPYIWAYVLFVGGIISNMNIWNRIDKNKPFNDQDALR